MSVRRFLSDWLWTMNTSQGGNTWHPRRGYYMYVGLLVIAVIIMYSLGMPMPLSIGLLLCILILTQNDDDWPKGARFA